MSDDEPDLPLIARLPLPLRRAAVKGRFLAATALGTVQGFGRAPLLVSCLRLPRKQAIRLDLEMVYHDWLASLEWAALLSRTTDDLRRDVGRVVIEDEATLVRLAQSRRPVLFTPLHMGCYALAFAAIMERFFKGRRMLILRARDDREIETRVMQRISETGSDMRFLKVSDKASYVEAIRFARAGAVIVSFVDLPAEYGGAIDIDLFGMPATIGMGVDALARVSEAIVVPLRVSSAISGDTVYNGRPFEVTGGGRIERQRVALLIKQHIETSVTAHPAEWHMWTRFPEFMRREPPILEAAE